jgi:putative ATP-dependent endonuclease of OLD family
MRLIEVKLTNFRGYSHETCVKIDPLTVLVGRNDAGKSSILDALDIFFNEATIERADCCVRTGSTDVRIACVFDELPGSIIIDDQYPTTLQSEFLTREDGCLEIIKTYNCNGAKGKILGTFALASHPSAVGIDELLSLKIKDLKTKAQQLNINLSEINQTAKAQIRQAIWSGTQELALTEREVSLNKESAKDAYDQIQAYMPVYALFKSDRASTDQDAEAQDPLKAAIKEAIRGREAELNGVIADIKNELCRVAERTVEKIREMNPELASQLHPTVKNKQWDTLFNVTLTGDDDIPINKRGSGTRRLVLLNFFRAKAEDVAHGRDSGVIYAVEEPETSQHPNYQLMLLEAFEQLVEQGRCQVLLTTHTPTLARRVDQSCLRLITRHSNGGPLVEEVSTEKTRLKIAQTLGVLPDHDVKVFFGVEGKHDISFLKQISAMLALVESDILDLTKEEAAGRLVFVPLGGSSLELWVTRLQGLNRPEFYLTDRDNPPPKQAKYQQQIAEWAERGCTAWVTTKLELENYLHVSLLTAAAPKYQGTGADFDDVPLMFAEALHSAAPGASLWAEVSDEKKKDKASAAKKRLNGEFVAKMTPELLTLADPANEVRQWLRALSVALQA